MWATGEHRQLGFRAGPLSTRSRPSAKNDTPMPIPDRLDIANALEDIAAGLRFNPKGLNDICWVCDLTGPNGAHSQGIGLTMREAAADAWVCSWPLSQMIDCIMGKAAPPAPDGRWLFELCPPGCWERVRHTVAARNAPRATGSG